MTASTAPASAHVGRPTCVVCGFSNPSGKLMQVGSDGYFRCDEHVGTPAPACCVAARDAEAPTPAAAASLPFTSGQRGETVGPYGVTQADIDAARGGTLKTPETRGEHQVQTQHTTQMGMMRSFGHRAACTCGFTTSFAIGMDRAAQAASDHAASTGHTLLEGSVQVPYERS